MLKRFLSERPLRLPHIKPYVPRPSDPSIFWFNSERDDIVSEVVKRICTTHEPDRARLEILHLGDRVKEMLVAILPAVLGGSREELGRIAAMDDAVDVLHGRIVSYLGGISQSKLTEVETEEFIQLMERFSGA